MNPVDASNQNTSLGDEQLDDSIDDTLVSVDGIRCRRKTTGLDIALENGIPIPTVISYGFQAVSSLTLWPQAPLALVPQHEVRGDHLLTDISDSLRVRGAVVFEGLL